MNTVNRRNFLKRTVVAGAALGAAGFSINARGANERVVLGVMGIKGRGSYLAEEFAKRDDVELRYLADPDSRLFGDRSKKIEAITGKTPQCLQDFRTILDDPEVDGVVMGTPDHWHALGTIMACQAGKDVFVEKPTSHSIWESRKMIEAARKYKRVVQVGAQNRSAEYCFKAFEYAHSKDFGNIHHVRVLNSKERGTIGKQPDKETPEGVDYDMWLGPAPMRPFNENHFHYAWHWFWAYSGGDIINDGVHQVDIARWMIDRPYPNRVTSAGGMWYFHDDQETPDTHTVNWDYDDLTVSFEQVLWAPYMKKTPFTMRDTDNLPNWPFSGTRIEIYGTRQMMFLSRHGGGWEAFDADGNSVAVTPGRFTPSNAAHQQNFIDCIRSRELPNADIEKLHLSTLLCHYGNIAYRTGRVLHIDPNTEGFVDDDEANALVKRTYREPYV
ncbi:MAG TPA: Gfo/Idh/MocA family oxidoreductase, partial [Candidatus Hydrogenedentes bacterium]|nr:Gfo/Idh/MocA family oxidoreductase [Candidatus Hydrogenedentota bacterium]